MGLGEGDFIIGGGAVIPIDRIKRTSRATARSTRCAA